MRVGCVAALAGMLAWGQVTQMALAGVRPAVPGIACVPGGVAAVPLQRDASDVWPATVPVSVAGLAVPGVVAWVGSRDDGARHWTRSPDQVDVRAIADAPQGSPPEASGMVVALFELPALNGDLEVLGTKLECNWLARAATSVSGAASMPWPDRPALDLPDPATPSEYWRWCLLAQRRGEQPPPPVGSLPERLWARHVASLWQAGLDRVRQASPGIYAELLEALTGTARDAQLPPPGDVAAWIARAEEVRALLGVLLNASVRNEQLAQSALSWLRAHWTVTLWVEVDAGDRVRVAAANPTSGEQVLRLTWVGANDAVPIAMLLAPGTVTRQWIDRPPLPASSEIVPSERMRPERLELAVGTLRRQIEVGWREYAVRPPALSFGSFQPPLSLADAQSGSIVPPPVEWRTTASMRRRQSRWELLVDCMRPAARPGAAASDESRDEVTLQIGDPEAPLRTVRVSADGRLAVDGGNADGAAAGFMRWPDRWRVRIELPDAWIPAPSAGVRGAGAARPAVISLQRTPGSGAPRQTAALAVPSWIRTPPPVIVDLGAWSDAWSR